MNRQRKSASSQCSGGGDPFLVENIISIIVIRLGMSHSEEDERNRAPRTFTPGLIIFLIVRIDILSGRDLENI